MYGTIAKLRVKPGKEEELRQTMGSGAQDTPGFVFAHVYRLDDDPQVVPTRNEVDRAHLRVPVNPGRDLVKANVALGRHADIDEGDNPIGRRPRGLVRASARQ